ncbi:MAG: RraA family protein [Proteobacteria bacterium]|nr:RraA family protein [Pseudomonadota bacterium]
MKKDKKLNLLSQLKEFATSEISDALDSLGINAVLSQLNPLNEDIKIAGPAYTVEYRAYDEKPADFKPAGNYIDSVPENAVIVIDCKGREDCSVWGDILSEVAIHKGIAGSVIFGAIRDSASIKKLNYPIFYKAITMCSGKNRVYKKNEQIPLSIGHVQVQPGDIIFADNDGVLAIPKALLEEIIKRATNIKMTENKIKKAVLKGLSLEDARALYHYHMPWVNNEK